jgi:hypothetical protein
VLTVVSFIKTERKARNEFKNTNPKETNHGG